MSVSYDFRFNLLSLKKNLFTSSHGTSVPRRGRLPTEPGPDTQGYSSPLLTSPIKSPPYTASTDSDDNSCKCK